jgi:hypothetical protein
MSKDLAIFIVYGYCYVFILGMLAGVFLTAIIGAVLQKRVTIWKKNKSQGPDYNECTATEKGYVE